MTSVSDARAKRPSVLVTKPMLAPLPPAGTTRILGIDPGSLKVGIAVIEKRGNQLTCRSAETLRLAGATLSERLLHLHTHLTATCAAWRPQQAAIEALFHHRNADSALKLGHARGVALLVLAQQAIPTSTYEPSVVKKAVTGYGGATKDQVRAAVRTLLGVREALALDSSDALAIAICHAHQHPALPRPLL